MATKLIPSLRQKARKQKWLPLLLEFIGQLRIQSKESENIDDERGGSELDLWLSQQIFLEALCDGLEEGVHEFYYLKSRQLGCTTVGLAIVLFWLAVHPRMIGCLVADNETNSAGFRVQLKQIMKSFPDDFISDSFEIDNDNKFFMTFTNGSRLDLLVAGQHKKSWADSKGYMLAWVSEIGNYGTQEGIDSFKEALSQGHPDRLFIFESRAYGYGTPWHDMWLAAQDDPYTKKTCFIGWWAKPLNAIDREDKRFDLFGTLPPNGEEREAIQKVAELYGHAITMEQLAWYRWRQNDRSMAEGSLPQQQPWTEVDAFQVQGYSFFQNRVLQKWSDAIYARQRLAHEDVDNPDAIKFRGYTFVLGTTIFQTEMREITDAALIDQVTLRIWHEPHPDGLYVIGCDPAYGRTEWADRSAISVWRAYCDRLVQCAEFADADLETHQAAWILAYLAGAYRNCIVNVELAGPGRAIMREFDQLRERLQAEIYANRVRALEWEDFLDQARWYLYHRPDSPGPGFAYNFECLAIDTPLPTPTGWTTMGEAKEGEYLISDTGEPTTITGLSEVKFGAKCYAIEFDDGTRIVADENHWWKVARDDWGAGDRLRQTFQLRPKKLYIRGYRKPHHDITSITEVESVPVRCVMVDGPTNMYLAGAGMIPTHNTTWRTKMELMNQFRDSFTTGILDLRSLPLIGEMGQMRQTRSDIAPEAPGRQKDDRVFAAALANRAWIDHLRSRLMQEGATFDVVSKTESGEYNVMGNFMRRLVYNFWRTAEERAENPYEPTGWLQDRGFE